MTTTNIDTAFEPAVALESLLAQIGLSAADAGGSVGFAGADPLFDSRLRLAAAFGIPVMACAVGASAIWRMRTGRGQDLQLDLRQAAHGIVPHYRWHPTLNGMPHAIATALDNFFLLPTYKTADGRTVMAWGVYPHLAADWLRFLGTPPDWSGSSPRSHAGTPRSSRTPRTTAVFRARSRARRRSGWLTRRAVCSPQHR